ncbi:Zinc finger DHHC-type containing 22 [Mactra antiquata]
MMLKLQLYRCIKCFGRVLAKIATDPVLLNYLSPVCYIAAVLGIGGWGVFIAIPFLYIDYDARVTQMVQTCGWFLGIELVINWLCLVFVDSTYNPSKHGGPPADVIEAGSKMNTAQGRKQVSHAVVEIPNQQNSLDSDFKMKNHVDKSVIFYFTWSYCLVCQRMNPPRAHHCTLCNKCVLKRDHHCFVASKCIGYNNLRHFSVFLFYAFITTVFSILHALPYAFYEVIPNNHYMDLFYPITMIRGILGFIYYRDFALIILGWMLLGYMIFSAVTLYQTYKWITSGKTSFEIYNKIDLYDTRDLSGKLLAVYGKHWWLNFIFPAHFLFQPLDDPIRWPTFKSRTTGEYFLI